MLDSLEPLFFDGLLMLYGHSSLWKPELVWLYVTSDSLIALFYYSISILLVYFLHQRRDLPYAGILMMFAAFTIARGTTHLINVWAIWHPNSWLAGGIEAITAAIALFTVLLLVLLLPKILTRSRIEYPEAANQALTEEIPYPDSISAPATRRSSSSDIRSVSASKDRSQFAPDPNSPT
jgi:hypothetical protein